MTQLPQAQQAAGDLGMTCTCLPVMSSRQADNVTDKQGGTLRFTRLTLLLSGVRWLCHHTSCCWSWCEQLEVGPTCLGNLLLCLGTWHSSNGWLKRPASCADACCY
jgi:hypothetical protein